MVIFMNMTLEERLYLLHEMKERQEENFAHIQSIPSDYCNRKVRYERSFYKKKNKSHPFSKLVIAGLFALLVFLIGKDNFKSFKPDDIPVFYNTYYTTLENKIDLLSDKIKSYNSIIKTEENK